MKNCLIFFSIVCGLLGAKAFSADYKNDLQACVSCRLANVKCCRAPGASECVRCTKNFYTCLFGINFAKKEVEITACNRCRAQHRACDGNIACARCQRKEVSCERTSYHTSPHQNSTEDNFESPKKRSRREERGEEKGGAPAGKSTLESASKQVDALIPSENSASEIAEDDESACFTELSRYYTET